MSALDILSGLILEDGRRWGEAAEPAQLEDAAAFISPDGPRRHLWLRARGRSKTLDAAGCALALMLSGELPTGAECYAAAADADQAALVARKIRGLVARSGLDRQVTVDKRKIRVLPTGVELDVLPADAASSWGLSPALLLIDEFCMWPRSGGAQEFLDALLSSLPKVPDSRALLFSTPSSPTHPSFKLFEAAVADEAWRVSHLRGPAPWQSSAELAAERRRLPESMYRRLFEAEWMAPDDVLTSLEDVRACVRSSPIVREPAGHRYAVGVDLSVSSDFTAVAVCHSEQLEPGSRLLVVDSLRVWKPSRRHPLDMAAVEAHIVAAARAYGAQVVADKYQAVGLVQRLQAAGISARGEDFTVASNTRRALLLHDLLRDRRLDIPNDAELVEELASLTLRETTPGSYRLASVEKTGGHRDRSTAISLAAEAVLRGRGPRMTFAGRQEVHDRGLYRPAGLPLPPRGSLR
ncbi:MAG TPA: hypothetical protein VHC43_09885 [Mycobacteriales bacterium]|nr:hypothetical protein [Mycobacteriales bacterium]